RKPTPPPAWFARRASHCKTPSPGGPNASVFLSLGFTSASAGLPQTIRRGDAFDLRRQHRETGRLEATGGWAAIVGAAMGFASRNLARFLPAAAVGWGWRSVL